MSKIIIFGNQKGGVGKSTITCLTANALSQAPFNLKVCVIDNDKQSSISEAREYDRDNRAGIEPPYDIFKMDLLTMQRNIYQLDEQYEVILIDTAGKLDLDATLDTQEITKALAYCDFIFLPFRAGNFNMDATLPYLRFLIELRDQRTNSPRPLNVTGFINMYRTRSKTNELLVSEVKHLKEGGVPFMVNRIGNFTIFEEVDTYLSLYDEDTSNAAKLNFTVWLNELIKMVF